MIKQQTSYDLYIYIYFFFLLILDTLLLRPSLHFTTLHPSTLNSTSLRLSTLHFLSLDYSHEVKEGKKLNSSTAPYHRYTAVT